MVTRRAAALAVALIVPCAAGACDTVTAALFGVAPISNPDVTPPVFTSPRPAPEVAVVSTEVFTIQVTDPGAGASGINPARMQAQVIGLTPVPITVLLPTVTVHLASVPDGPLQVVVVAEDFAGNSSAYVFTTHLDRESPAVTYPSPPDPSVTTSMATLTEGFVVQVGQDPNFEAAQVEVLGPGPDGTCGTGDDAALPASEVALPVRVLPAPGIHPVTFFLNNPVAPLGQPSARLYCWIATARDTAQTLDGEPDANVSTRVVTTLVTWNPPPPQ